MLPQFRHANSVMTRLDTYDTVTLPNWLLRPGVAAHVQTHAMEHVHWMARLIDDNRGLIKSDELFYEKGTERRRTAVDVARGLVTQRLRTTRMNPCTRGIAETCDSDVIHEVKLGAFINYQMGRSTLCR